MQLQKSTETSIECFKTEQEQKQAAKVPVPKKNYQKQHWKKVKTIKNKTYFETMLKVKNFNKK